MKYMLAIMFLSSQALADCVPVRECRFGRCRIVQVCRNSLDLNGFGMQQPRFNSLDLPPMETPSVQDCQWRMVNGRWMRLCR
jgi:hypothetical protein